MTRRKAIQSSGRSCEQVYPSGLAEVLERHADLTYVVAGRHCGASGDNSLHTDSNEETWEKFRCRQIHDTRRVTLEKFHLFEWFPLIPGKYHTEDGRRHREEADRQADLIIDGRVSYSPYGKLHMLLGGVGCVRLRPRVVSVGTSKGEYYFMTASSTGVCHEGFPVLLPRSMFGRLMPRLLKDGSVPATLGGEMRYVDENAVTLFRSHREIPLLYLHVDKLTPHRSPRQDVTEYAVSVAASFEGVVQEQHGMYVTYDTFDPANKDGERNAAEWILEAYVEKAHGGTVVTDFDEVVPQFPRAEFGLLPLLAGRTDLRGAVADVLGLGHDVAPEFVDRYRRVLIDTRGGPCIVQSVVQNVGTIEAGGQVTGIVTRRDQGGRPGGNG
ncbi:hypothetical protein V5E97_11390 [Singulisphaera sp. Ch08]|uniref:Uncharacterized protein n=1 Tax=Singulisphaera sp. Ch08 TaxID=3120278 RepID=A0AAU7CNB9_9BACT